jgi:hypothetical protein
MISMQRARNVQGGPAAASHWIIDRQTDYAPRVARAALSFLLATGWLATDVMGAPAARQRVVLEDPDPELRHAMEQALAPWHLQVVIEDSPPTDAASARERADADTARFIVWREGAQLVVYDRELGSTERRDSRSGMLDPPTAAAAALTIKTMMRLPPLPKEMSVPVSPAATLADPGLEVRVQIGAATRIAHGTATDITERFGGAVELRPWASSGWRFGLAGDGGTATSVFRAGFKGTWSEWTLLAGASWTYVRAAWEFEPHAGIGVRRSSLTGAEMGLARNETAMLPTARGGVRVRWRLARWTFGVALDVDGSFGTPTYIRIDSPADIFQVPRIGVELGTVIAVDL